MGEKNSLNFFSINVEKGALILYNNSIQTTHKGGLHVDTISEKRMNFKSNLKLNQILVLMIILSIENMKMKM